MLCFLYTNDYHDEGQDPSSDFVPPNVEQIIKMALQPESQIQGVTLSADSQRQAPPNLRKNGSVDANALLSNVSVYAIADKYDVSELKKLAICKFKTRCVGQWDCGLITTITKAVYESTPANDRGLRDQIIRICFIYAEFVKEYLPFKSLLLENGEIALDLINELLGHLNCWVALSTGIPN